MAARHIDSVIHLVQQIRGSRRVSGRNEAGINPVVALRIGGMNKKLDDAAVWMGWNNRVKFHQWPTIIVRAIGRTSVIA